MIHAGRTGGGGEARTERVIYGDVLFLINFSMDYLTLCLTGKLLRRKARLLPLIFAAAAGGVYGVAAVVLEGSRVVGLLINLAVSGLMCYIAFGRPFILAAAVFNVTGLFIGGAVTAAFTLLNGLGGIDLRGVRLTRIPSGTASAVITAAIAAVCVLAAGITARAASKRRLAPELVVEAYDRGRQIAFTALTDSGNLLTEPVGGAPVIITSYKVLEPLLPDELMPVFRTGDTASLTSLPLELMRGVRLIPATGAFGDGLLIAYRPERIKAGRLDYADACIAVAPGTETARFGHAAGIAPAVLAEPDAYRNKLMRGMNNGAV